MGVSFQRGVFEERGNTGKRANRKEAKGEENIYRGSERV
jgi:hypothetical protein